MKTKELVMIGAVVVIGSLVATYIHDKWLAPSVTK